MIPLLYSFDEISQDKFGGRDNTQDLFIGGRDITRDEDLSSFFIYPDHALRPSRGGHGLGGGYDTKIANYKFSHPDNPAGLAVVANIICCFNVRENCVKHMRGHSD